MTGAIAPRPHHVSVVGTVWHFVETPENLELAQELTRAPQTVDFELVWRPGVDDPELTLELEVRGVDRDWLVRWDKVLRDGGHLIVSSGGGR